MKTHKTELIADLLLFSVTIFWGSTFIIVKKAIEQIPTFAFLSIRFWISTFILTIIFLPRIRFINMQIIKNGSILGTILFLAYAFQTVALEYTYASIVGFLTGLNVIIVPLLSIIFYKKMPHLFSWIGVFLATVGMTLLSFAHNIAISLGDWLTITCAFFVALQIIFTDKYSKMNDPILLTIIEINTVAILSTLTSIIREHFILPYTIHINSYIIFSLVMTSIFATVYAFVIQNTMQQFTTPTKTAVIFTMEPVFSGIFGYFIGNEILSSTQYFGAFLIFIGILTMETLPNLLKKYYG